MDVPPDRTPSATVHPVHPQASRPPRRRPTGAPPPLPYHLQTSGVGWLVATLVLVGLALAVFGRGLRGPAIAVTVADDGVVRRLAELRASGLGWLWRAMALLGSWPVLIVLGIGLPVVLVVLRRWRHLLVWLAAWNLMMYLVGELSVVARRPRPFGVELRAGWGGWAMPSMELTHLTVCLMGVLYTLVPEGRWRNTGKWVATGLVALVTTARMVLGVEAPTDVLVTVGIGVCIPLIAFRRFTPGEVFPIVYRRGRAAHLDVGGARGLAIRRGLHEQLGLVAEEITPFGLSGSAGSTPLRIKLADGSYLFGKLYAGSHLRADRWYKLGRELLYGQLEDEKPFNAVRRLVQQEDYALRLCRDAGLPSPTPHGFVELTPDREYLLVTEFLAGAVELGEADIGEQVIDDGLGIVRRLWAAGLAHRDIKPANLLVRDGRLLLIDVAFVETRPSPWRQAVDLANMMLCLGLRSDPEQVYQRALRQFSVDEITEGFAAARGLALPSQLRRMLKSQGRDLHERFVRLLPRPPQPIRVQRWSARRVGLSVAIVLLLVVVVTHPAVVFDNRMAVRSSLGLHSLDCGQFEPLWLEAQSVPSASLVPCVRLRLPGWRVADVAVNDGRSVIALDQDRAGQEAVVLRLAATCDTSGTAEAPAPAPGVRRFQRLDESTGRFAAAWYDRFPGGCVTYQLQSSSDIEGMFAAEVPALVAYVSRDDLRRALAERSGGRLALDPRRG